MERDSLPVIFIWGHRFISGIWSPHIPYSISSSIVSHFHWVLPTIIIPHYCETDFGFLLKPGLCLSHLFTGILQSPERRQWDRKQCVRKSHSFLSSRGALVHESISFLVFIPLHIILMSLQLPHHYLLVRSISNLQAWCLLPVKLRHVGRAVKANWYFRCQGAHWLLERGQRTTVWLNKQALSA